MTNPPHGIPAKPNVPESVNRSQNILPVWALDLCVSDRRLGQAGRGLKMDLETLQGTAVGCRTFPADQNAADGSHLSELQQPSVACQEALEVHPTLRWGGAAPSQAGITAVSGL